MYVCANFVLVAIWFERFFDDGLFRLIPTFFVIGLAALITWIVAVVIELKSIAMERK